MTEMTAIVFRHDGVLAHYAGDGLEAFWNAPIDPARPRAPRV